MGGLHRQLHCGKGKGWGVGRREREWGWGGMRAGEVSPASPLKGTREGVGGPRVPWGGGFHGVGRFHGVGVAWVRSEVPCGVGASHGVGDHGARHPMGIASHGTLLLRLQGDAQVLPHPHTTPPMHPHVSI